MPNKPTTTPFLSITPASRFNQRGQVARVLKEFDKRLTKATVDTLELENSKLSKAKKAEREEELRKEALPDEREFEKKLAKAYRKDYGQPIPERYMKQAARAIKNLIERVRFYTYHPSIIPVADYAPPLAGKPGGKKFIELDNKSWASISEPGDERYPGWHQSTTQNEDIFQWLEEDESNTPSSNFLSPSPISPHAHSPKRERSPESAQTASKRLSLSPYETDEICLSDSLDKSPLFQTRSPIPEPEETQDSASPPTLIMEEWLHNVFPSAPTPAAYASPVHEEYNGGESLFSFDNRIDPPYPQISRAPTPGLNFKEELIQALQAQPRSTEDIVHYFQLAHSGRPEQKARALFRLSRALEQEQEINIDRYLYAADSDMPDSGPPSGAQSPVQVFNRFYDDSSDEMNTETTGERGRSRYKKRKTSEAKEESRQRIMNEFRQIERSGIDINQLDDLRFPFYNRKRLSATGQPPPRSKPKGEVPGRTVRQWIKSETDS